MALCPSTLLRQFNILYTPCRLLAARHLFYTLLRCCIIFPSFLCSGAPTVLYYTPLRSCTILSFFLWSDITLIVLYYTPLLFYITPFLPAVRYSSYGPVRSSTVVYSLILLSFFLWSYITLCMVQYCLVRFYMVLYRSLFSVIKFCFKKSLY